MKKSHFSFSDASRRDLMRLGMLGIGVSAAALPMPPAKTASQEISVMAAMEVENSAELLGINTRIELAAVDKIFRERKLQEQDPFYRNKFLLQN